MPPKGDAAEILSRFPGPVTLYTSRRKWLFVFAVCALFSAGGFAMIQDQATGGWYVLVVFGIGAAIAATIMFPGAGRLELDADGFACTSLFRRHRVSWRDASNFAAVKVPPANITLVGFDDVAVAHRPIAAINVKLVGRNSALPDTFGLAADDLVRLMAEWRERALAQSGPV